MKKVEEDFINELPKGEFTWKGEPLPCNFSHVIKIIGPQGADVIDWDIQYDGSIDLKAEMLKLQTEETTKKYARQRKIEYDKLNQFELMTDDAANSTTTHADAIAAIKTKWPKDHSGPVE
jgi:hypothetical protein